MSTSIELTASLLRIRAREVVGYLRFLRLALENDSYIGADRAGVRQQLNKGVTHTLKANLCLLLYSAMEATLVQLMDEMYEAIGRNCKGADQLNGQLLLMVARNFKGRKTDGDEINTRAPLHVSLFQAWVADWKALESAKDKRAVGISGSVDSRAIAKQLRKFGVLPQESQDTPAHLSSPALLRAKNRRNQLAHGEKSFAELGKDLAFEELREDARQVFLILIRVAKEVDSFLTYRRYLAAPFATAAA